MRICRKDLGADYYYYYKCTHAVEIDGKKECIINFMHYIANNSRLIQVQFSNVNN